MKCAQCERPITANGSFYNKLTLEVECSKCNRDGIPYHSIGRQIEKQIPSLYKMSNNSISARLYLDQLIYLLKFAKDQKTTTISTTVGAIVNMLKELYPLTDMELENNPLYETKESAPKKRPTPNFLVKKGAEKQQIQVGDDVPEEHQALTPEESEANKRVSRQIQDEMDKEQAEKDKDVFII